MKYALFNIFIALASVTAFCFIWFSNSSAFEKSTASFAVVLAVLYMCAARGALDE